jgi:hypothetical protein
MKTTGARREGATDAVVLNLPQRRPVAPPARDRVPDPDPAGAAALNELAVILGSLPSKKKQARAWELIRLLKNDPRFALCRIVDN